MLKELQVRRGRAERRVHDFQRVRALDLEAIGFARDGIHTRGRTLVALAFDIVAAGRGVILHPVVHGGAPDEIEQILVQVEQDHVADDEAVPAHRHELFGFVDFETLEAVDSQLLQEFAGIRPGNIHVRHVIGLLNRIAVFCQACCSSRQLVYSGWYYRIWIRTARRVAQHLHRATRGTNQLFSRL